MAVELIWNNPPIGVARGILSEEDCKSLVDIAIESRKTLKQSVSPQPDWADRQITVFSNYKYFHKIKPLINQAFLEYIEISNQKPPTIVDPDDPGIQFYNITEWKEGEKMGEHFDTKEYGIVFYLNNNFEGGELYYRNSDDEIFLELKPEPGMVVFHPHTVKHGTKNVISGTRYVTTAFRGIHMMEIPDGAV
jgi:hypothetical protein